MSVLPLRGSSPTLLLDFSFYWNHLVRSTLNLKSPSAMGPLTRISRIHFPHGYQVWGSGSLYTTQVHPPPPHLAPNLNLFYPFFPLGGDSSYSCGWIFSYLKKTSPGGFPNTSQIFFKTKSFFVFALSSLRGFLNHPSPGGVL